MEAASGFEPEEVIVPALIDYRPKTAQAAYRSPVAVFQKPDGAGIWEYLPEKGHCMPRVAFT